MTKQERADHLISLCEEPVPDAVLAAYRAGIEDAFSCASHAVRSVRTNDATARAVLLSCAEAFEDMLAGDLMPGPDSREETSNA